MAINVNTVYQTVLLILNKEQRGLLTPDEFNKIATQVQLDIFEQYFDDLNQQIRVPQTNTDYADRVANIEEKMSIFQSSSNNIISNAIWTLPSNVYYLNNLSYKDVDMQKITRNELLYMNQSPLTKPTESFPVYVQEGLKVIAYPDTIRSTDTSNVVAYYIRKPEDVVWGFTTGSLGQYLFTPQTPTRNFELSPAEQTEVILKILQYAGIVIRDPQIVQAAASEIAQNEANQKS